VKTIHWEFSFDCVSTIKDFLLLKLGDISKVGFNLGLQESYVEAFTELANHVAIWGNHPLEGPQIQKYLDKTHTILNFYFGEIVFEHYMQNNNAIMVKKLKHTEYINDLSSIISEIILEK
jgi:hypothetical protein